MKTRLLLATLAVIAFVGWIGVPAFTEEEPAPGAPAVEKPAEGEASPDEMHDAWTAMGVPGEHHKKLDFMVGTWTATTKFWMPGNPTAMEGTGGTTTSWIMGGRYVRSHWKSQWEGQPFTGESTIGYNNATKEYENTWIDSMSTAQAHEKGTLEGNVLSMTGKQFSPMGPIDTRGTLTKVSDDEYTMETWWLMPGMDEFKVMEIHYKRAN